MKTFNLPDLGEGLQEAEIVDWHVGPGDQVVADQPLVSVETDKAVVEVPSPRAGRIGELFGDAGDIVKVGAPLVAFEEAARGGHRHGGRRDHGLRGARRGGDRRRRGRRRRSGSRRRRRCARWRGARASISPWSARPGRMA